MDSDDVEALARRVIKLHIYDSMMLNHCQGYYIRNNMAILSYININIFYEERFIAKFRKVDKEIEKE